MTMADDTVFFGKIGHLLVTDDRVLIVDYKTDCCPEDVEVISKVHLKQIAIWRIKLHHLYPRHRVYCALLWTQGPTLTAIADSVLDDLTS
jgi:ATP-dependent helicase/nuclease subunit A